MALAIPELDNPYFAELAGAAIREAAGLGYTLVMEDTAGERERELMVIDNSRRQIVDGADLQPGGGLPRGGAGPRRRPPRWC